MSTSFSSKRGKYQYQLQPSIYGDSGWYIYEFNPKGEFKMIGPYLTPEEAEADLRNLENES